jgi:hypothetical protein
VGVTADLPYRRPITLSVPARPQAMAGAERAIFAAAASGGLIGTSFVAGRYQAAVATTAGVLHLTAAAVLTGSAFTRYVDAERRPAIIGALAAATTLALLTGATHAAG